MDPSPVRVSHAFMFLMKKNAKNGKMIYGMIAHVEKKCRR